MTVRAPRLLLRPAATVDGFEADEPQAKVVRLAKGSHYIFTSNPTEVEREMNAFMDGLVNGAK